MVLPLNRGGNLISSPDEIANHYPNYNGCQLYDTASAERLKLDSIHREGIRIYTGTFKTASVESLHAEASDPPWNLKGMNWHQN